MKPFTDTLAQLRQGRTVEDLTAALAGLLAAVDQTEGKGTLTITLKVAHGKGGQIEIDDSFKVVAPQFDRETTIMYLTPQGNLQRNDPRQPDLPGLRKVPEADVTIRYVDTGTGEIINQPSESTRSA